MIVYWAAVNRNYAVSLWFALLKMHLLLVVVIMLFVDGPVL